MKKIVLVILLLTLSFAFCSCIPEDETTTSEPVPPPPHLDGLFDRSGNQLSSWDALVNDYGFDMYNTEDSESSYFMNILERNKYAIARATTLVIGEGVEYIPEDAFASCKNLVNIEFPSSMKIIGKGAFMGCQRLEKVSFPDGLLCVDDDAFVGCYNLKSIEIPASVTFIGNRAFESGVMLESINVSKYNAAYRSEGNCLIERVSNRLVLGCKNSVIPQSVTVIGNSAFESCDGLESIVIPASVTEIDYYAFQGADNLKSVTFEKGSKLTVIRDSAFLSCDALETVDIPAGVTEIGRDAFYLCVSIKSFTINSPVFLPYNRTFHEVEQVGAIYVPADLVDEYKAAEGWSKFADSIKPIK